AVDLQFGENGADIGLAWQMVIGPQAATDAQVDAQPVQTGWSGPSQPVAMYSVLGANGLTIASCQTQVVTLRFVIMGNSSLPFDFTLLPIQQSEFIVDNRDAGFASSGG